MCRRFFHRFCVDKMINPSSDDEISVDSFSENKEEVFLEDVKMDDNLINVENIKKKENNDDQNAENKEEDKKGTVVEVQLFDNDLDQLKDSSLENSVESKKIDALEKSDPRKRTGVSQFCNK